jgi:hypothetical protein
MEIAMTDPDEYEAGLRRSSARNKVISGIATVLFLCALLAWRGFRLFRGCGAPARPPAAAVVRVAGDGSIRVDGCTSELGECLQSASTRQGKIPGGGNYECLVVPAVDAPDLAMTTARRACYAAQLSPAELPRGAKW